MLLAHDANTLKVLECAALRPDDFIAVEVKGRHSAQQKVGCLATPSRKGAQFDSGHAEISGNAFDFLLAAACPVPMPRPHSPTAGNVATQL